MYIHVCSYTTTASQHHTDYSVPINGNASFQGCAKCYDVLTLTLTAVTTVDNIQVNSAQLGQDSERVLCGGAVLQRPALV